MTSGSSQPRVTAVLLDDDPDSLQGAACPMCHTLATVSRSALAAGDNWRCDRCKQHWDAARLATVAAYATWTVDHDTDD